MPSLHFQGKTFVQNLHLEVKYHQLLRDEKLSMTEPATGVTLHYNLIIKGDNLTALKALLAAYAAKSQVYLYRSI